MAIATCIGCGCHDYRACYDEAAGGPCSWLAVDYVAGRGVCSACPDDLARWEAGDRAINVPVDDDPGEAREAGHPDLRPAEQGPTAAQRRALAAAAAGPIGVTNAGQSRSACAGHGTCFPRRTVDRLVNRGWLREGAGGYLATQAGLAAVGLRFNTRKGVK